MINVNPIKSIAIVGAGAVGCFFGGMLAKAGLAVTLIGRQHHVEAINKHGLQFEHLEFDLTLPVKASAEIADIKHADLILVCVKSQDTLKTASLMKPYVHESAIVMSFQNGVDNAEILATELNRPCYPVVVYVAAAMAGNGQIKHFGRGELVIGSLDHHSSSLITVAELFNQAHIPTEISAEIKQALWSKFLVNCVYNAISAIGQINYSKMARIEDVANLAVNVVTESSKAHANLRCSNSSTTRNLHRIHEVFNQCTDLFINEDDLVRGGFENRVPKDPYWTFSHEIEGA